MKVKKIINWQSPKGFLLLLLLVWWIPSAGASSDVREIQVVAALSPTFEYDPDWKLDVQDRILFANKIFEPSFKVHFAIKRYVTWELEDETRETDLLIEELRTFIPLKEDEIIVGFHKMSQPFSKEKLIDYHTLGTARSFRGVVVVRDPFGNIGRMYKDVVLTHEIGHLFGAVHVSEKNAIMYPTVPGVPSSVFDPDNREIMMLAREVDFREGEDSLSDEAIQGMTHIYEKLIRQNPHSDFYYQLGSFYRQRNEFAKAVSIWEEAVRYHYDNPYIHRELGFHYFQSGRYQQAVYELGASIAHFILPSQKKQKATALNFLGAAYFELGNMEQAIFSWLQGLTSNPDDLLLQGNLAVAYMQKGDTDRGIAELEKLIAKDSYDPTLLSNLGVAWIRKAEYEKAIFYFRRALTIQKQEKSSDDVTGETAGPALMDEIPESKIRLNLGAAYLRLESYEEARTELEFSKKLDPGNYDVHRNLAQAYLRTEAYDQAIKELDTALRYKKDDAYLYAFLAEANAALGRDAEAVKSARDGLRYADDKLAAVLYHNVAVLYAKSGRLKEAIAEFKSALNKDWNRADTHTQLGVLQARLVRHDQAKRSLKTALKIDPDYEPAKEILSSLDKNS